MGNTNYREIIFVDWLDGPITSSGVTLSDKSYKKVITCKSLVIELCTFFLRFSYRYWFVLFRVTQFYLSVINDEYLIIFVANLP